MTSIRKVKVPAAAGFVKKGFEHVQDVFRKSIEDGVERGGSFAAYHKGELVVNLWGGFADEECQRPWTHNTASHFYSTTKSVSAMVMGHIVEKGLLTYDQPVSDYWPQFAQKGKEKITLKQILSLKAGLPVLSEPFKLSWLRDDREKLQTLLAEQKPWDTGDAAAYSPIVIGLYLDTIVRKVDTQQRGLSEYFHAEIALPFGIDVYIGLPKSEFWRKTRQVVTVNKDEYRKFLATMSSNPNVDQEILLTSSTQPSDFLKNVYTNIPDFAELPCGSSHGVGSAAGMAKLHGILANGGRTADGHQLLSEETIQTLHTPLHLGPEKLYGMDFFYGCGMDLLPVLEEEKLYYNFGHGGFGGQYAAADAKHRTGWAYCTNYIDPTIMMHGNTKWTSLERALFECVHALEGVTGGRRHIETTKELQSVAQRSKSRL